MAEPNVHPRHGVKRLTRCETRSVLKQAELTWIIHNFAAKCDIHNQGRLYPIMAPQQNPFFAIFFALYGPQNVRKIGQFGPLFALAPQQLPVLDMGKDGPVHNKSQSFTSADFHAEGDEDIKWHLTLWPNEKEEENQTWMSLFLFLTPSTKEPPGAVSFWLSIGAKTTQAKSKSGTSFEETADINKRMTPGRGRGYSKFVLRDDVLSGHYLVSGSLTLSCNLQYEKELEQTITVGSRSTSYRPSALEAALSQSTLSSELKELFTSAQFSDVCFVVDDKEFPAHKMILSFRSPVFAALIELRDEEMSKDLLAAADRYLLDLLKHKCELFLGERLTLRNCSELLLLADLHNASHLKEMSSAFIRRNASAVMKTDGWKKMKHSRPQLFCDILEDVVDHSCTT